MSDKQEKKVANRGSDPGFRLHTKETILTGMEDKEDWFQLQEVCKLLLESSSNILPITANNVGKKQSYQAINISKNFINPNLIFAKINPTEVILEVH